MPPFRSCRPETLGNHRLLKRFAIVVDVGRMSGVIDVRFFVKNIKPRPHVQFFPVFVHYC